MSYVVPIHKPTAVRNALKLSFLEPGDDTLVVAKASRLEFYSPSADGYVLRTSLAIYGYVTLLERIRPASAETDHLFVGTDRYQYFTVSWDSSSRSVKTEQSYVDQADKVLRDSKELDKCHIDPTRRYMSLTLFDGVVTIIPLDERGMIKTGEESQTAPVLQEPLQVRIEELQIRASAFLQTEPDSTAPPRLAVLWEDNNEIPQLKLRELRFTQEEGEPLSADLETVSELRASLDEGVSHIIPVPSPVGGFLLLGESSIQYVDQDLTESHTEPLNDKATIWSCWTQVDDTRFLLGDDYGHLFFLMLDIHKGSVRSWQLDSVGESSRAATLVYLDEGLVFVGSHTGDSQIVQIQPGGVEVKQTFENIAPILDFSIMDLGRGAETSQAGDFSSGQARILTASGAWQDGSIRSVRSGVGMDELGTIAELPGITDLWSLSSSGDSQHQDTLVAAFVDGTRVFRFDTEDALEELDEFQHFELSQPTLLATNLPDDKVVQVHETGLVVSQLQSGMSTLSWHPPEGAKVTAAAANSVHLLVVEGGHTLHVFHPSNEKEEPTASKHFDANQQISSVTLPESQSNVCIVSFWQTAAVAILDLHTLDIVHTQNLGTPGVAIPRSVLVANILPDSPPTLFIAMADGTVMTLIFDISKNTLSGMSRILLGTEPVHFKLLPGSEPGLSNIFGSCEQPSLIYASEGRIVYSAVSSNKTSRVCPFSSPAYPGAVAVASPDELKLAMIGKERTTQLQTLPTGETVRCLAYQPKSQLFGVGCIDRGTEEGTEFLTSRLKLATEVTFSTIDEMELRDQELVECIITTGEFETDDETFGEMFVVGTSINPDESTLDSSGVRGRILVFEVTKEKKIAQVCDEEVKGAVRSLAMCDGRIVAGLVKAVVLYALVPNPAIGFRALTLSRLAQTRISSNPMSLAVTPSTPTSPATIAVADLMKSLTIVEVHPTSTFNAASGFTLKEVSRHFATIWSSACTAVSPHQWLLADMEGNLTMLRRDPTGPTADDRRRLQVTGEFRLGEVVNKIASIASPTADADGTPKGKARARTLSGSANNALDASAFAPTATDPTSPTRPPRVGPLITPRAFLATVEGAIYLYGSVNAAYLDVLLRLQRPLAERVRAPGGMPWAAYRGVKTLVREAEEPFRFVDGEVLEQGLVGLGDDVLGELLREAGLAGEEEGGFGVTVEEARAWGEELRRLY